MFVLEREYVCTHYCCPHSHRVRFSPLRWVSRWPGDWACWSQWRRWRWPWSCACVWGRSAPDAGWWCRLWACRASRETQTHSGSKRRWGWPSECTSMVKKEGCDINILRRGNYLTKECQGRPKFTLNTKRNQCLLYNSFALPLFCIIVLANLLLIFQLFKWSHWIRVF